MNRKILRHSLFDVHDRVFNIESNHFARGQFANRMMRQQRESLENEFVMVVLDDCWRFGEEIGRWRYGDAIMIQFPYIIRLRRTFGSTIFAEINSMANASASWLHRAPTQRAIVHFISFVVPQIGMQAIRMFDFLCQFFHRKIVDDVQLLFGWIGRWAMITWKYKKLSSEVE